MGKAARTGGVGKGTKAVQKRGVQRSIAKVKKKDAPPAASAAAVVKASEKPEGNSAAGRVKRRATGPAARKALAAAAASAAASGVPHRKSPIAAFGAGHKQKMNGARMMAEIYEARAFAEPMTAAAAAAREGGSGRGKSRSQRKKLSRHQQEVLRATREQVPFELPSSVLSAPMQEE
mmetsp:Transcript_3597/g.8471  ORF Transcript_3597/g.8471 Transcript_3597/m.8471 type:complete len:177 (-) Transcript_3597:112-642(-)